MPANLWTKSKSTKRKRNETKEKKNFSVWFCSECAVVPHLIDGTKSTSWCFRFECLFRMLTRTTHTSNWKSVCVLIHFTCLHMPNNIYKRQDGSAFLLDVMLPLVRRRRRRRLPVSLPYTSCAAAEPWTLKLTRGIFIVSLGARARPRLHCFCVCQLLPISQFHLRK